MTRAPHPVDAAVSAAIRTHRLARGLTLLDLAEATGQTYQQLQKYESGANRVSASRLWTIAGALGCDLRDFFAGLDACDGGPAPAPLAPDALRLTRRIGRLPDGAAGAILRVVDAVEAAIAEAAGQGTPPRQDSNLLPSD